MSIKYITNLNEGNNTQSLCVNDFINRLKNKRPTYEFTGDQQTKCKLYFDVDCYTPTDQFDTDIASSLKNFVKNHINTVLQEHTEVKPRLSTMISHGETSEKGKSKYSIRVYISNIYGIKPNIKSFVKEMNSKVDKEIWDYVEKPENGKLFDESVYDQNRKMRCFGTSKDGENRPLVFENEEDGTIEDTIITGCFDGDALELKSPLSLQNPNSPTSVVLTPEEETMNDIDYLLCVCIQNQMCKEETNKEWSIIGQALKNELGDEATQPFLNWTYKFGTENKKQEALQQITKYIKKTPLKDKERVTIKTIHYHARKCNEAKYKARFCKSKTPIVYNKELEKTLSDATDYAYATYFCNKWGKQFKCIDIKNKLFYEFTKNAIWEEFDCGTKIREIISNEMYDDFKNHQSALFNELKNYNENTQEYDKIQEQIHHITEQIKKLGSTNHKNNITREIMDKICDPHFEKHLNREKYMLPIKNKKVINMNTLEITDRTIEHPFSYECDADYVPLTEAQEKDIKQYFLDLFCGREDTTNCVINILKSMLSGETLRYIFFFTGSGCNGKSLLFKVLNHIFKKSMDTIDTKVILETKQTGGLTTEFEKLDKTRLGYVTELKSTDKLNTTTIKKITGGDAIDFRGLYKSNTTITPTCNLGILTNELPKFDVEKAIMDRIIIIPFNNTFQVNSKFENELISKSDLIFSYIMKNGIITDKFELSDEMLVAKQNYKGDNIKLDHLGDFIGNYYEVVDFVKKEKIERDVFRSEYNNYLKSKGEGYDKSSHQKFTRLIQNYKIGIQESNGKTYYTGLKLQEKSVLDEE